MLSVLDIFRIGIGPSSSHTVGPMRIAARFANSLRRYGVFEDTARVETQLRGSLAFTGKGHATPFAVMLGLLGFEPETYDPLKAAPLLAQIQQGQILLAGQRVVSFTETRDIIFDYETETSLHPNELYMAAYNTNGDLLRAQTYFSTGGGFIASQKQLETPAVDDLITIGSVVPYPFGSAAELLAICDDEKRPIHAIILANEDAVRPRAETEAALDTIYTVMMACIDRGLDTEGTLPGGLEVKRRAPAIWQKLHCAPPSNEREQLFDWLNVYAMAVNEENAAGGQVVTAPTNGAAGIIPAVLRHYCGTAGDSSGDKARAANRRKFLLTAGGIGLLYKQRASISGAEMGCQGEVGVACSMAAGGLVAVWGAADWRPFGMLSRSKSRALPKSEWNIIWALHVIQ